MSDTIITNETATSWVKWLPLFLFCLIQIGASGDSSILVNATTALLTTFKTTVAAVQIANAIYPLVASAVMIIAGFLGLMIGWKRLLQIGLILLAVGELLAAISPSMTSFTYVARVLTGIGGSVAVPGILGLIPALYTGREQAIAFSGIAAANGLASAIGPVIGGALIVSYGWRWAFLALSLLFAVTFVGCLVVPTLPKSTRNMKFDLPGALLIMLSIILVIFGLLTISDWGLIKPISPPFTFLGISPSLLFVALGLGIFLLFLRWQTRLGSLGRALLLPPSFTQNKQVRDGLILTALIFFCIGSFSFLIITFLQVVVGFNAIESGWVLADYAAGMVIFSLGVPLFAKNISPRTICRTGVLVLVFACFIMAYGLEISATNVLLLVGLFLAGAGCGLVASQSSIVITSAIPVHDAEQSGGIQGTMRNLGQAVGVAVSGMILISALTGSIKNHSQLSPYLSADEKAQIQLIAHVPFISNEQIEIILEKANIPTAQLDTLININERGRLHAARVTIISLGFLIFLFIFGTNNLPSKPIEINESVPDVDEKPTAPVIPAKAGI